MDEREQIQVNIRLPLAALEGLSKLAEQLQALAAWAEGGAAPAAARAPREQAEGDSFDFRRFQELQEGPPAPESAQVPLSRIDGAQPVHAKVHRDPDEPNSAGEPIKTPARSAESENTAPPPKPADTPEESSQLRTTDAPEAPDGSAVSVRAAADTPLSDAPAVQAEPEDLAPPEEAAPANSGDEPEIPTAQAERMETAGTPLSAGLVIRGTPEAVPSRWGVVTEELAAAGPAPLTAEAVSQAFQRDGRRYDSGFPLY